MDDVFAVRRSSVPSRPSVLLAALLVAAAATSCSSKDAADTITLSADGPAGPATVTYRTPDGERTEEVALPWTTSFEASGDFVAEVRVVNPGLNGEVSCRITGARLPADADGEAAARCSVSRRGDSGEVSASGDSFVQVNGEPAAVASVRLERPTSFSPRGVALQGELAWFADGGPLTGIGLDGSERTSTAATDANGVTTTPDGTVWAVSNGAVDGGDVLVAIAPDLTERTFPVPDGLLAGPIAAVGDEVWAIAYGSAGGEVIRYSTADGGELGRLPGGEDASFASSGAFGAVVEVDGERIFYDAAGNERLRLPRLVMGDGPEGTVLVVDSEPTVALEISMSDLEAVRTGTVLFDRLPERIVTAGGVTAAVAEDTLWLIDPATLDPACEFSAGMTVLGVSETAVWLNVPDVREVAVYQLADLPC